ncbi:hypothetical protein [Nannocystis radixulma]|uniref:Outer membrane protein beta-barrel domain-containing protein n=1 Tax=Nannocystis radixulma TaxID=2995305 RepID=A0ABT5BB15_9BACT|nr:hypothetical protein [Nannocystis radixulma]MDC0670709.1 hypothetical protein [Nannocystis radixulma]
MRDLSPAVGHDAARHPARVGSPRDDAGRRSFQLRGSGVRGRLVVLAGLLAGASLEVHAAEPSPTTAAPFRRRGGELGLFADSSIASQLTLVGFGLRGGWFLRESVEIGGELQATMLLASPTDPSQRPRAGDPAAAFRVAPMVRWIPLRTETFAAYLLAAVGPQVLGARGGVLGHAVAAPGAMVHLGGRVWLDLAIRFSLSFPGGRCRAAFSAPAAPGFCELQFGPQIGLLAAF